MANDLFAVAVGASAGGVDALLHIASALPRRFPALVLVTQHVGDLPSILPELMRARGPNPALHPRDGEPARPGTIYIAPPGRHMLLRDGRIRLSRGPKENYSRPAIDPMFRSVALALRARAIGVVLSGHLDDGAAGLAAIKQCGGTAIVQDPATAREPSMPRSALESVDVDLCLRIEDIVPALERIVGAAARQVADAPPRPPRRHEPVHAGVDRGIAEDALWGSVRSLQERESLLRRVARIARARGDHAQAQAGERRADEARTRADDLVRLIERRERGA